MTIPVDAIKHLVEYLHDDAQEDYENYCEEIDENGNLLHADGGGHVFISLEEVEDWLATAPEAQAGFAEIARQEAEIGRALEAERRRRNDAEEKQTQRSSRAIIRHAHSSAQEPIGSAGAVEPARTAESGLGGAAIGEVKQ